MYALIYTYTYSAPLLARLSRPLHRGRRARRRAEQDTQEREREHEREARRGTDATGNRNTTGEDPTHRGPTQRGGPRRGPTTGGEGHTGDPHRTHTDNTRKAVSWPIQDIVLFLGLCARINTTLCAPTLCLGTPLHPVIAQAIAQYNVPPQPPVFAIYITQYWQWLYRAKAKE